MTWKARPRPGSLPRGRPREHPPDNQKRGEGDGSLPLRGDGRMNRPDPRCQSHFTILWTHFARLFENFFLRRGIHDKNPIFLDATSPRQRRRIDRYICHRFGHLLGYRVREVPCRIRCTASRSGIFWIDLEAELKGIRREFHIGIANRSAIPDFGEGFYAQRIGGIQCDEPRIAARLPWLLWCGMQPGE